VPHSPHPVPRSCPALPQTQLELALQFRPQPLSIPESSSRGQDPQPTQTATSCESAAAPARRSVQPTSRTGTPYCTKSGLAGAIPSSREDHVVAGIEAYRASTVPLLALPATLRIAYQPPRRTIEL
jgi:hypothetical protein